MIGIISKKQFIVLNVFLFTKIQIFVGTFNWCFLKIRREIFNDIFENCVFRVDKFSFYLIYEEFQKDYFL